MKTIVSTPNIIEAEQIIALLDENGIDAQMLEDNGPYISASGDMNNYRIIVNDDDTPSAEKIVADYRSRNNADTTLPWCPECGSEDVSETIIRHRFGSIWLLLLAPVLVAAWLFLPLPMIIRICFVVFAIAFVVQFFIPYKVHRLRCNKCNHVFKHY